jgi:hypothetical protein
MNHEETPSLHTTMDTPFDAALRQYFRGEPEPDDDGFSQRVSEGLPERVTLQGVHWVELIERAQWTAIGLASCGVAALWPVGGVRVDTAQTTAAYTLIGLLIFWSIPSRWSRG